MKYKIFIDKDQKEEIIIYCKEKTKLSEQIEKLIDSYGMEFIGFKEREAIPLDLNEIYSFVVEMGKVTANTEIDNFQIKYRLYQLEELLPDNFIKINQSCIVNIRKIKRFFATVGGTLNIELKNGYKDYVSRRNIKKVKERLGLK